MGLVPEYIDGQTPLDDDDQDDLLITTIATRGELDEFEQLNIEEALVGLYVGHLNWKLYLLDTFNSQIKPAQVLIMIIILWIGYIKTM